MLNERQSAELLHSYNPTSIDTDDWRNDEVSELEEKHT